MARRWLGAVAGRLRALICCGRVEPTFSSTTGRDTVATAATSAQDLVGSSHPAPEFTPASNAPSRSSSSVQNLTKPSQPGVVNDELSESNVPARAPRSKALLIGIHYTEHFDCKRPEREWPELTTPGKDVRDMHEFLQKCGYNDFYILLDKPDPNLVINAEPTKEEIITGLEWLVKDAGDGDKLFLHCHGAQVNTTSSSESDGCDEAIVPLCKVEGKDDWDMYIIDNTLSQIVVRPLQARCTLLALFDCCHSGTMLDLTHKHPKGVSSVIRSCCRRAGYTNRPKTFTEPFRAATTSAFIPQTPSRRSTKIRRRGTVQNLLRLNHPPQYPATIPEESGVLSIVSSNQILPKRGSGRLSNNASLISTTVQPNDPAWSMDPITRVSSPEPMTTEFETNSIISHPSLRPPGKTSFPVVKRHTFAQWNSPDKETTPVIATVIAISGCMDSENLFDLNDEGGLLTSTFIACMSLEAHREGVSLDNMCKIFSELFKMKTNKVHANCPTSKDGKCDCPLPTTPPSPLFTSTIFLSPQLLIRV